MPNTISHIGNPAGRPSTIIEVFADIWCPFTHMGLRALNEQLSEKRRGDVRIWVRSWPLEWVNGKPMDPAVAARHGVELRSQVAPELFEEFDGTSFPRSTIPVLALVAKGYKVGFRVGESLSLEVREVLFEQGQDVSDPETLARIGRYFDLAPAGPDDYATVVQEWKEGIDRGVRGSPHFFCADTDVFCPSLDITRGIAGDDKAINRNVERLGAFVDHCLSDAPASA